MGELRRNIRRSVGAIVSAFVLTLSGTAPLVGADDPEPSDRPGSTAPASTTAPTSSTTRPSRGPDGTKPDSTTTTRPEATTTSTTEPDSSTTTVVPPVDDGAVIDGSRGGYASTPAPLIPSMEDDPLFHAARLVDDGLRKLALAKVDYLEHAVATATAAEAAEEERAAFERVRSADTEAAEHLMATRSILQAAAVHAYAGYGTASGGATSVDLDGTETVSPNRTYVRVTIADATRHVGEAEESRAEAGADLDTAQARYDRAIRNLDDARAAQRSAKAAVTDAQEKLDRDRDELREQVGAMADFAPGAFDDLPDVVDLPEGAVTVESPVGTIVVPESADPRTAIALEFVIGQIGKPYIWGGTGPTGFDCSGLLLRGFQAAGVTSMPRVSQAQQVWAEPIEPEDLQPGDFVFFGKPAYHIGVYIGGGLMINAPYTGARVRVDRVWSTVSGYGRAVW